MKRVLVAIFAVLLLGEVAFPAMATAQTRAQQQPDISVARSRFVLPANTFADAAQSPPAGRSASPGGKLIRNVLIGAAIGAGVGLLIGSAGDCGACGADRAKGVLGAAMYGAMIGAAVRIHPSRRPVVSVGAR